MYKLLSLTLILLCLYLGSCGSEPESPSIEANQVQPSPTLAFKGTIVAMGDSLTAGFGLEEAKAYPAILQEQLQADGQTYRVINAGVSGETSSGALTRIDWVLTLAPDIVILETGGNDSLRGINPSLTAQNIDHIISIFKEKGVIVVLAGMQTMPNLGQAYITAFAEMYPALAEKHGVIFIPLFFEGIDPTAPDLIQADGIHPTAAGYEIIVENLYPYLLEAIETFEAQ